MASRKSPLSLLSALLLACASLPHYATAAPYPQPEPQQNVQWVTSIWTDTLTQTHTSIYSVAAAMPVMDCAANFGQGSTACGSICCSASQKCQYDGQCIARDANDAPYLGSTAIGHTYTTQYSAPYRPTSGATGTAASATASSTSGAGAGGATGGGTADTGLSGGAIAGIVIGSLAGVVLLLLLCACCIVRGLWHGFLAIFGIGAGKRSRERETVVEEERYARHSGRRDSHGSWYAGAGGRPSGAAARKESSGKGLMGAGAALGTLWLLLGMKKDKKKETRRKSRSENSSYYYSDYTSSGSPSKFFTQQVEPP